jgi:hypothetical protein
MPCQNKVTAGRGEEIEGEAGVVLDDEQRGTGGSSASTYVADPRHERCGPCRQHTVLCCQETLIWRESERAVWRWKERRESADPCQAALLRLVGRLFSRLPLALILSTQSWPLAQRSAQLLETDLPLPAVLIREGLAPKYEPPPQCHPSWGVIGPLPAVPLCIKLASALKLGFPSSRSRFFARTSSSLFAACPSLPTDHADRSSHAHRALLRRVRASRSGARLCVFPSCALSCRRLT